jgi:integrase/recombinase XerD
MASRSLASIRQNSYTVGLMRPCQDATPPPKIIFLTQDEVRRLFAVITGKRDRALFQLAYHHGLRASEVSLLQRDDVHAKQGRIYIPRVKGSIAKTYPLQPEDLRLVRAYLRTREDDSPYLFISARGIPLERRSYWDLM